MKNLILPGESKRRRKFFLSKAKLSTVVTLCSFFSGFAIRSVANLQINANPNKTFLVVYVVLTTLLAVCTCFAIVVATWILPLLVTADEINDEIERILKKKEKAEKRTQQNATDDENQNRMRTENENLQVAFPNGLNTFKTHKTTVKLAEIAWICAGTIAVFLFVFDVITVIWIKFQLFTNWGVIIATGILVAVIFGLGMFGVYFRLFVVHKFERIGTTRRNKTEKQQPPKKRSSYGSIDSIPNSITSYENRSVDRLSIGPVMFNRRYSNSIVTV